MSRRDLAALALAYLSAVPLAFVLFGGVGSGSNAVVAVVTGIAMLAAGYTLSWGTESLQTLVSPVLALAALALVQVLPEYSIEAVLAHNGALDPTVIHYATASMTGANRLLLGLGWPSVVLISYAVAKRKGLEARTWVKLERQQSLAVLFLLTATLYSFLIIVKGNLTVVDGAVLVAMYAVYLYLAHRLPARDEDWAEELEGPASYIAGLRGIARPGAVAALLLVGFALIYVAASPFVGSILALGATLGFGPYLFVQRVAPFLTEIPEGMTALIWASRVKLAPMAIANLVSSKVNQWTMLLATIPIVYSLTLSSMQPIVLTGVQSEEIFITAAQSLFGAVCLLDMKLEMREALALLALFLVQFFIPPVRIEVGVAYLVLAALEFAASYKRLEVLRDLRAVLRPGSGGK